MFEFFVALFGGIYYASRISADKAIAKRSQQSFEARWAYHENRRALWEAEVYDPALEEDLSYFIADRQNREEVWKEVCEAYLHMPLHGRDMIWCGSDAALDIMLAKRGKVCKQGAIFENNVLCSLPRGEGQCSKEEWDRNFEFWLYIRDELRRNSVNARLIFKPGLFGEDNIAYDADNVKIFHYLAGRLTWLPLTCYNDNLTYM